MKWRDNIKINIKNKYKKKIKKYVLQHVENNLILKQHVAIADSYI